MLSTSDSWRSDRSWCEGKWMLCFSPFKSLKFPVAKELRGHMFQSLDVYLSILRNSIATWAVSPPKWASAGWWVSTHAAHWLDCVRQHTATACARAHESQCVISTLLFSSILTGLSFYYPTFFPSGISLSSHSFRQVLCKWTYDGTHQVVLDDNS